MQQVPKSLESGATLAYSIAVLKVSGVVLESYPVKTTDGVNAVAFSAKKYLEHQIYWDLIQSTQDP